MLRFDGRVALVTGATRGLGLAIARRLHAGGCTVALNYAHADDDAERAVKELGDGAPVYAVKGDATLDWQPIADEVLGRHGHLDILVHNTSSWRPMSAARADLPVLHEDVASGIDPLLRAVPLLRAAMGDGGRIVAVSSSGSQTVIPGYVSLGVAKAALESLVRYLAVELARDGIAVNAVSTAKLDKGPDTPRLDMVRALAARTPAGRLTQPDDVAAAVALLCTPEAAWIQGQILTVDGGLSLCT